MMENKMTKEEEEFAFAEATKAKQYSIDDIDDEECFYCHQYYPRPINLHHTIEECEFNLNNY